MTRWRMPPDSWCGIAPHALPGVRDRDQLEQLLGPLVSGRATDLLMGEDDLGQLLADREDRVERGHRVLEDHRDPAAAQLAEVVRFHLDEVGALEQDRAAGNVAGGLRQEAEDRERRHALAAAGFADDPDRLVGRQVEGNAIDGMDASGRGGELDAEIADREQRLALVVEPARRPGRRAGRHRLSLGSRASRRPSPRRLKPSTEMTIATPGKRAVKAAPLCR